MKLVHFIIAGLIVTAVAQSIYFYPHLPASVASHFGSNGQPNGWSSKEAFFLLYFGALLFFALLFSLVPKGIQSLPASMINLPNRDYWLAPDRREGTYSAIWNQMHWLAAMVVLFIIVITQLTINANLNPKPGLPSQPTALITLCFMIAIIGWAGLFITRFTRKPLGA